MPKFLLFLFIAVFYGCHKKETGKPLDNYVVAVRIDCQGTTADAMEHYFTQPLSEVDGEIPDVINCYSTSRFAVSVVILEFPGFTDKDEKRKQVWEKVERLQEDLSLPDVLILQQVIVVDESYWPVLEVEIINQDQDVTTFENDVNELYYEILRFPEITRGRVSGLSDRYIQLDLYPERLEQFELTTTEVTQQLQFRNDLSVIPPRTEMMVNRLYAANYRIRVDVNTFGDRSFGNTLIEGTIPLLLYNLAKKIDYLGENTPPDTARIALALRPDESFDQVSNNIERLLISGPLPNNYRITRLTAPASPRGLYDLYPDLETGLPELHYEIDREKCAQLGIAEAQVTQEMMELFILFPELEATQLLECPLEYFSHQAGDWMHVRMGDIVTIPGLTEAH